MSVTFQAEKMGRLLTDLLGRNVTVKVGAPPAKAYDNPVTASYSGDNGELVAVCLCDLELTLNGGAALCMIPPYEVANCLKTKSLDPSLFENFKEILNIFAQLFGGPNAQRVKLSSVESSPNSAAAFKAFIDQSKVRREVQLVITGYGNGKVSVYC